ncbi:MAG: LysR family transcriptional regulator [Gemmatimonadetes bacterium]|nr:LysR family transcriptional regulator [Gemmatimonadota bacterium]
MTKPALSLHRLELFLAILDAGGVGRAARARNISQPAVSEHLRGLEAHFGIQLFDRAGRTLRPTPAAREIEPYARQVLDLVREAGRVARGIQGLERGSLTIGASTTPGTYLLPAALGRFHDAYPGVTLNLLIENTREIERRVAAGQVDLGVIGEAPLLQGLVADQWLTDRLVLIVARGHSLARRRSPSPQLLRNERYIAREAGSSTRAVAERYLARLGVSLAPAMELGSTEAVREAVAAGLGVALVSRLAVRDRGAVPVVLAGPQWKRDLLVIRRAGAALSPPAAKFRELLLEERAEGKRRIGAGRSSRLRRDNSTTA